MGVHVYMEGLRESEMLLIKARRGNDIRRISIHPTAPLTDLVAALRLRWSDLEDASCCTLKWRDEEGDLCTIATQHDWAEASSIARVGGILQLLITEPAEVAEIGIPALHVTVVAEAEIPAERKPAPGKPTLPLTSSMSDLSEFAGVLNRQARASAKKERMALAKRNRAARRLSSRTSSRRLEPSQKDSLPTSDPQMEERDEEDVSVEVSALLAMGFKREQARAALDATHDGSVEGAVELLLSGGAQHHPTDKAARDGVRSMAKTMKKWLFGGHAGWLFGGHAETSADEVKEAPVEEEREPAAKPPAVEKVAATEMQAVTDEATTMVRETEGMVGDLVEMGFDAKDAHVALGQANGVFKDALRALVRDERARRVC